MKRQGLIFGAILFLINLVHADVADSLYYGSGNIVYLIESAFGPFFNALLGGDPNLLFEKVLLFFIITCVVYMVIKKRMDLFNDNYAVVTIITFSVSILSTRFMLYSDLVETVILPYSVLGVTLSAFLPLLIGFFFIQSFDSGFLRKTFWIFFIVVFFAMWEIRYDEVGSVSWIYFWSAVIALLFFLFDGTIRRALMKQKMVQAGVDSNLAFAREIRRELQELHQDYKNSVITQSEYNKLKDKYTKQLKDLAKF